MRWQTRQVLAVKAAAERAVTCKGLRVVSDAFAAAVTAAMLRGEAARRSIAGSDRVIDL